MSYLLDTNVVCEVVRPKPSPNVIGWLNSIPPEKIYISVLTVGEIRKGIEKLSDKNRKEKLINWLECDVSSWFEERMLAIDREVADRWGRLLHQANKTVTAIDSLLAATALHYDLRLVTRNMKDFNLPLLETVNPWEFSA